MIMMVSVLNRSFFSKVGFVCVCVTWNKVKKMLKAWVEIWV